MAQRFAKCLLLLDSAAADALSLSSCCSFLLAEHWGTAWQLLVHTFDLMLEALCPKASLPARVWPHQFKQPMNHSPEPLASMSPICQIWL